MEQMLGLVNGCYALTEPQAGSNAAALTTKAVLKGDRYVVNGTKAWITNGGAADAAVVYVNTQPEKGEKGITALVVEKGTRGFAVGKEEKKPPMIFFGNNFYARNRFFGS